MSHHRDHDDDQPPPSHDDNSQHPAGWPTVDEAVDHLLAVLSPENLQIIRNESHAITFHFTLGRWIRNTFGLWQGNHALFASCAQWGNGSGHPSTDTSDTRRPSLHPDDASAIILEALHERLRP